VSINGKDNGKRGRVLKVLPAKNRLIVEGVNMIKRHTRPNPQRTSRRDHRTRGGAPREQRAAGVPRVQQGDARRPPDPGGRPQSPHLRKCEGVVDK